jgi:hypothetical protein
MHGSRGHCSDVLRIILHDEPCCAVACTVALAARTRFRQTEKRRASSTWACFQRPRMVVMACDELPCYQTCAAAECTHGMLCAAAPRPPDACRGKSLHLLRKRNGASAPCMMNGPVTHAHKALEPQTELRMRPLAPASSGNRLAPALSFSECYYGYP